jgi:sugar phosphate isomerase/epimerase
MNLHKKDFTNYKETFTKALSTFKDDVKVIHLKDFYLEGDGIKQCGLGKGIIDFKFIVETAKKYSPNATLVFEGVVGEDIISSKKLIDSYN